MLCADLIDIWWLDDAGHKLQAVANLEDISSSGLCLQMDDPIPSGLRLHICHENVAYEGLVRYCVYRDTGYFIGVQFEDGSEWDERQFHPKHLLDPRTLLDVDSGPEPAPEPQKGYGRIQ